MKFTIAIDGPVGAGKSSVADGVAQALGILHLDTGAMYRSFAWKALQEGVSLEDEEALVALTEKYMPEVQYVDGAQRTLIGGEDVTGLIRTPEISMAASCSSKFAGVRKAMVARQQELASRQNMLLDGRDIGTVVLPDATLKVFLTASPEVRAKRRYNEMIAKGEEADYDTVLKDVIQRDEQDMNRTVTPLRAADDAIIVDSSYKNKQQVIDEILRLLDWKCHRRSKPAEHLSLIYRIGRGLTRFLEKTIFPVKFHHEERAMLSAPYMLVCNHRSFIDPLVAASGPISDCYHVRFLGKKELLKTRFADWLLKKELKMIGVERGKTDIAAVRTCLRVLNKGHVLGIFPEGTRKNGGTMEVIEDGTAMMAMMGKVLILPCYIDSKLKFLRTAHVYYGEPFSVSDLAEKGISTATCQEANERIKSVYVALREEAAAQDDKS